MKLQHSYTVFQIYCKIHGCCCFESRKGCFPYSGGVVGYIDDLHQISRDKEQT